MVKYFEHRIVEVSLISALGLCWLSVLLSSCGSAPVVNDLPQHISKCRVHVIRVDLERVVVVLCPNSSATANTTGKYLLATYTLLEELP